MVHPVLPLSGGDHRQALQLANAARCLGGNWGLRVFFYLVHLFWDKSSKISIVSIVLNCFQMGRPGATLTDEQNSLVRRARVAWLHRKKGGPLNMAFQPQWLPYDTWLEYHMAVKYAPPSPTIFFRPSAYSASRLINNSSGMMLIGNKTEVCWRYPGGHSLLYYTNLGNHRGAWGLCQWCSEDSASSSSGRPFDSFLHQFAWLLVLHEWNTSKLWSSDAHSICSSVAKQNELKKLLIESGSWWFAWIRWFGGVRTGRAFGAFVCAERTTYCGRSQA